MSDKGTNFMSSLMSELRKLLSIRKLNTTPYHPQTNGLVEMLNETVKRILQIDAQDQPGKWDMEKTMRADSYNRQFSAILLRHERIKQKWLILFRKRSRTVKQIRRGITIETLETEHLTLGIKCWSCYRQAQRNSKHNGKDLFP